MRARRNDSMDEAISGEDTRGHTEAAMHIHRASWTRKTTLSITVLLGLVIAWLAVARAAAATSGFTITSSSSVQFWVHDAPWADLHYQINSGVQLNVRMVANGTNHTYDVTAIPSGMRSNDE